MQAFLTTIKDKKTGKVKQFKTAVGGGTLTLEKQRANMEKAFPHAEIVECVELEDAPADLDAAAREAGLPVQPDEAVNAGQPVRMPKPKKPA